MPQSYLCQTEPNENDRNCCFRDIGSHFRLLSRFPLPRLP